MLANTKIVQAFIEAVKDVTEKVTEANDLAQSYKSKWIALNPDLIGTNLTANQLSVINNFVKELDILANNIVVTTVKNKSIPSHGTGALD